MIALFHSRNPSPERTRSLPLPVLIPSGRLFCTFVQNHGIDSTNLSCPAHFTSKFMVDEVRDVSFFVSYKLPPAVKLFGKQFAFGRVTGKQFVSLSSCFTDQMLALSYNGDNQFGAKLKPVLPDVFVVDAGSDFFSEALVM